MRVPEYCNKELADTQNSFWSSLPRYYDFVSTTEGTIKYSRKLSKYNFLILFFSIVPKTRNTKIRFEKKTSVSNLSTYLFFEKLRFAHVSRHVHFE